MILYFYNLDKKVYFSKFLEAYLDIPECRLSQHFKFRSTSDLHRSL